MRDVWSNDPDRTTRRGDTRKTEDVTVIVTETIRHGGYTHVGHGNGPTVRDALISAIEASPYYSGPGADQTAGELIETLIRAGRVEYGWATYTFGV